MDFMANWSSGVVSFFYYFTWYLFVGVFVVFFHDIFTKKNITLSRLKDYVMERFFAVFVWPFFVFSTLIDGC